MPKCIQSATSLCKVVNNTRCDEDWIWRSRDSQDRTNEHIGKIATAYGLVEPIRAFIASGKPVWGTGDVAFWKSVWWQAEQGLVGTVV